MDLVAVAASPAVTGGSGVGGGVSGGRGWIRRCWLPLSPLASLPRQIRRRPRVAPVVVVAAEGGY
uniref:Uncharacterized protein n=1 Tax=Oryza punctata TaxID=4537 RepID=A0A0E0LA61_ORYPU